MKNRPIGFLLTTLKWAKAILETRQQHPLKGSYRNLLEITYLFKTYRGIEIVSRLFLCYSNLLQLTFFMKGQSKHFLLIESLKEELFLSKSFRNNPLIISASNFFVQRTTILQTILDGNPMKGNLEFRLGKINNYDTMAIPQNWIFNGKNSARTF